MWKCVLIDDYIPCYNDNRNECFSKCKDTNYIWVPLIEKAYAKIYSSYSNIEKASSG